MGIVNEFRKVKTGCYLVRRLDLLSKSGQNHKVFLHAGFSLAELSEFCACQVAGVESD